MRREEEEGLLQEVRERPGDDAPRLAYADWLEDRAARQQDGDPDYDKSRFIRAQLALHGGRDADGAALTPGRRGELEREERRLLARRRAEWEAPLRALGAAEVAFGRGLPEGATVAAAALLANVGRYEGLAAPVTSLRVTGLGRGQTRDLLGPRLLCRRTRLELPRVRSCPGSPASTCRAMTSGPGTR